MIKNLSEYVLQRTQPLFGEDLRVNESLLQDKLSGARILVVGAAGTIGKAVTKELMRYPLGTLHAVDLSENNLVELVRDIRSSDDYSRVDFRTCAIDCGSREFEAFIKGNGNYDFIFNLSALKHVRSEKDPFTLMRMIRTNVFNAITTLRLGNSEALRGYFCVSTDKAANPVNLMGGSKRIMEHFLMKESSSCDVKLARFANVAFSDGSLLHGFNMRLARQQPISAPSDIRRYFIAEKEAGTLCLLAGVLGDNRDLFFPKLKDELHLTSFADIAIRYIESNGYEPVLCESETEARAKAAALINDKKYPVYLFTSDTTGEKPFEEFYTDAETLELSRFIDLGIVKQERRIEDYELERFERDFWSLYNSSNWQKRKIVELFESMLPELAHEELGHDLDQRM